MCTCTSRKQGYQVSNALFVPQLQVGEFILSIDGGSTSLLSVGQITAQIKGAPGSAVELEISSTPANSASPPRRQSGTGRATPENLLLDAKDVVVQRGANGGLGIR